MRLLLVQAAAKLAGKAAVVVAKGAAVAAVAAFKALDEKKHALESGMGALEGPAKKSAEVWAVSMGSHSGQSVTELLVSAHTQQLNQQ